MNIRSFIPEDSNRLKEIHEKYYKDEFKLEDFLTCNTAMSILDDNKDIITTVGFRHFVEIIGITNKDKSPRLRREALLEALRALKFAIGQQNHTQLHAFVQDEIWLNQLKRVGFKSCKGSALFLEI